MKYIIALCLLLSACVVSVGASSPTPNLALQKQSVTMHLHLDTAIHDAFDAKVMDANGAAQSTIEVSDWHETLAHGFKAGFASAFTIVDPSQPADLTFDLLLADLSFVPVAPGSGGAASYLAEVRCQARVVDKNGQTIAKAGGRPRSHGSAELSNATATAQAGVEAMYEALSGTFFANIAASQPASQLSR